MSLACRDPPDESPRRRLKREGGDTGSRMVFLSSRLDVNISDHGFHCRPRICALLGATQVHDIDGWLARLCQEEILEERRESRFSGERAYRFRHALMRDAVYALL